MKRPTSRRASALTVTRVLDVSKRHGSVTIRAMRGSARLRGSVRVVHVGHLRMRAAGPIIAADRQIRPGNARP